jgi:chromosome segregation ATPase
LEKSNDSLKSELSYVESKVQELADINEKKKQKTEELQSLVDSLKKTIDMKNEQIMDSIH